MARCANQTVFRPNTDHKTPLIFERLRVAFGILKLTAVHWNPSACDHILMLEEGKGIGVCAAGVFPENAMGNVNAMMAVKRDNNLIDLSWITPE